MAVGSASKSVCPEVLRRAALAWLAAAGVMAAEPYRLITLDPGHFHAALIQKEMHPELSRRVAVYAPLGPDLAEHLRRIAQFNQRGENPTSWELEVHCSADYLERMLRERPGAIVMLSGRNSAKMDRIVASIEAGMHVLADKPWTLASRDIPRLAAALDSAGRRGLAAWDIMTERYETTCIVARAMAADRSVFGYPVSGAPAEPGAYLRSVHHIMKSVAGVPVLRPVSFFNILEQGEALSDVGVHLADLAQWTLFPEQAIDYRTDIRMLAASHWPAALSQSRFQRVTGAGRFPAGLTPWVKDGALNFLCNNSVSYLLRGVHVRLDVLWNYEAPPGMGDLYEAVFRGSRAGLEIRQGEKENYRPEFYIVPGAAHRREVVAAARALLARRFPGYALQEAGTAWRVVIPDRDRTTHEDHFSQVARQFFQYVKAPASMPSWEKPNMAAKYWVTTRGVEMANAPAGAGAGSRLADATTAP